MRCPTCGEILGTGTSRCPTCGASVSAVPAPSARVQQCPRCAFTGQGVPYFTRTGHVGLLVAVSLFTYGMGGLVYWLVRRKHRICPGCGLGWESAWRLPAGETQRRLQADSGLAGDEPLPSGGVKLRMLGALLIVLAGFAIVAGIVEFEMGAIAAGSVLGAAGSAASFFGWKAKQERRQALMTRLQRGVLRLATRRGGTLTVTEVAAELDLSIAAAEKVLVAMDDGFRVRSEITREGVLIFEFPEVQHRTRLEPGGGGGGA